MSTARQQKPFSQQRGRQRKRIMKNLKNILNRLSNSEIDILLKNYFLSKDSNKILNKIGYKSKAILNKLLINLKNLYFNIDKKEKYKVLSIIFSIYSKE